MKKAEPQKRQRSESRITGTNKRDRPVERLVAELVGEVFHFGFGRHYDLGHVVLLTLHS